MAWTVLYHDAFLPEFEELAEAVQDELLALAELLGVSGPTLGRPHADTLAGSKHANMKELRFTADDGVWRVAFAFDPKRRGQRWSGAEAVLQGPDRQGRCPVRRAPRNVERISTMPVTHEELMARLPKERQKRIEARAAELRREVEGLKVLRKLTRRSQEQIAQSLGIKQPSAVKIERQTDLYLSTLRQFVEAAGGKLELCVELPGTGAFSLTGVGEIEDAKHAA